MSAQTSAGELESVQNAKRDALASRVEFGSP